MKEKLSAGIIILAFILFSVFLFNTNNRNIVLEIKTPTMFSVDLNNNHIEDDGETVCVPNLSTYTANLAYYKDEIKELPYVNGIRLGYLADEFARNTLTGKHVQLKFTGEQTPQCKFAEIILPKKRYSDLLKLSGFAINEGKFTDNSKAQELIQTSEKLKLVIFNHKSEKYHKLDCKYGKIAHDAVILEAKDLPKTSKACKFCHIKLDKTKPTSQKAPDILSNGSVKLFLTDYTQILRPDRHCTHAVCKEIVSLTNSSIKSIDIALYGWSDIPKLKSAILNAEKRGVNVRIVYDIKTTNDNYYTETETLLKEIKQTRSDEIPNDSQQTNYLMHNKFLIFDNKIVVTGSMNYSHTGLSGFNQNNVVVITSNKVAEKYTDEFNQMFNGKFHNLKASTPITPIHLSDGSKIKIYFSPQDKGITKGVIPLIENAKDYIYIPAFLITHKPLTKALIAAKARGIDVKIILDATSVRTRNSSLKELRMAGIPVKIENYAGKMHSKSIIIDDKFVISGSANLSNSGENKNDENQIIIENNKIAKFYKEFFLYLWAKIPDKYLKSNPPAESKDSIGSCSDGIDNDYDGKIDNADEGCTIKN